MSVKARVVRAVEPRIGDGVSYGMTYRVSDPHLQIATIPLGYADGLSRSLSNKMDVLVKGQRVHQVGRICMDQCIHYHAGTEQLGRNSSNSCSGHPHTQPCYQNNV